MKSLTLGLIATLGATALAAQSQAEGMVRPDPSPRPSQLRLQAARTALSDATSDSIAEIAYRNPERLYKTIRETLAQYIENPESLEMKIRFGDRLERLTGRIDRVEVKLEKARVKGLEVQRGFIVLEDAVLDLPRLIEEKKFRFREKGKTEFYFEVDEDAINSLLDKKGAKLKVRNAKLRLENDRIAFSGKVRFLFFNNHVSLHGSMFARNETEIHFVPQKLRLDFLPVPGMLLGAIRRKINPVADLADFRFHVRIGALESTKSRLLIASKGLAPYVQEEVRIERAGGEPRSTAWPPSEFTQLFGPKAEEAALDRTRLNPVPAQTLAAEGGIFGP